MSKVIRSLNLKQVVAIPDGYAYKISKMKNTTKFYIGEVLESTEVDRLISAGFQITITNK